MVRVRNLVLAIAAATALTSEMAYALGLGEVTLKSALNQPLVAEIELLDAKTLSPGEVIPVLASVEDFNRAGVDRQYFLSDLKFTPILRPNGRSVIQVSSSKPVREPYLNFLVEVLWPSGRLLREYTLLLDPPLYSPETVAAVAPQMPVASQAAPQRAISQTLPPRASTSAAVNADAPASPQAGGEYKTSPRDTLWEIAERIQRDGTVHQTMMAIQDLNPNAFINGNINLLKSGQVLRLPDAEQVAKRSHNEAVRQVAQNEVSWRQARAATAASVRQLDATPRVSAEAASEQAEPADSLRLVAPDTGKSTAGSETGTGDDSQALRDKLAITQESLDSSRLENADLKDRLDALQGQLDKLQQLMQLKDNQLAEFQAQLAAGGVVPAADSVAEVAQEGAAPVVEDAVTAEALPSSVSDPVAEPEVVVPPVTVDTSEVESVSPVEPVAEEAPEPVPQPVAVTTPMEEAPEPSGFFSGLLTSPLMLGLLGGGALLALLIGLMAMSRRNAMKEGELDDAAPLPVAVPASAVEANAVDADLDASHEAAPEEVGNYRPVEQVAPAPSDALAEADIYIAYGRFNQAAELLQNALNNEPQRSDLHLKLMEVYAELGDRDGFAREQAELREMGGCDADVDQLRGRYPSMVVGAAVGAGAAVAANAATNSDFGDFSLDDVDLELPAAPAADAQDMDDTFDLSLDDLDDTLGEESSSEVAHDKAESEMGLGELSFGELVLDGASDEAPRDDEMSFELDDEPKPAEASIADELGDFSLDLDAAQNPSSDEMNDFLLGLDDAPEEPAPTAAPAASEIVDFDFDLPELAEADAAMLDEFDDFLAPTPSVDAAADSFEIEPEKPVVKEDDFSFDLSEFEVAAADVAPAPAPTPAPVEDVIEAPGEDFDFFSESDEAATKLDLARAYIDMGDADGARDILDEVMVEGNDVQQKDAREMLAKLA